MTPVISLTDTPDAKARAARGLSVLVSDPEAGAFARSGRRHADDGGGRGGGPASRLSRGGALHDQLPGPRLLREARLPVFGSIACDPPGTSRIFMVKDL